MIDEFLSADALWERVLWLLLIVLVGLFGAMFFWTDIGYRTNCALWKIDRP